MDSKDLLAADEPVGFAELEAWEQKDADHAAGMLLLRADRFANAEDWLALVALGEHGRGKAKGRGCCRCLLEQLEDARVIMTVVAAHQFQQAAFRR